MAARACVVHWCWCLPKIRIELVPLERDRASTGHGLVAEWARRGPKTAARGGWSRHAVPWAKRPARSRVVSSVSPFGVERERVRRDEYWSLSWGTGLENVRVVDHPPGV